MDTEAVEEALPPPPCCNNDLSPIAKGKRTKRHRPHSPIHFSIKPAGEYDTSTTNHRLCPTFSSDESTTTEEEDIARCLILLAQGHSLINLQNHHDFKRKRHEETTAADACMYACKTCDRVFPSFQALGGHRASHKKLKNEKNSALVFSNEEDFPLPPAMASSKNRISSLSSLQLANISAANATATAAAGGGSKQLPSPRNHECSYCGAEFTSGQALGGHMRRHRSGPISRPSNPAAASIEEPELEETKKPINGLSLDLNLPMPEDENKRFGFSAREQKSPEKLALSDINNPTMVDCHY